MSSKADAVRTTPRKLVLVALAAVLLGACGAAGSRVPAGAAAVVNGVELEVDLLERLVRAQVNAPDSPVAGLPAEQRTTRIAELQRQVLTQLIQGALFEQAADDLGITVTDEEIDERLDQEAAFQGSAEQLAARIAELGYTQQEARDLLRGLIIQDKLQERLQGDVEVSDADVRDAYEAQREAQYEQAVVSHILVDTEEEANALLDLLEDGASFEELAEERSTDTFSASQGGSLGQAPINQYVEPFAQAVRDATPGELVGPVETEFGFHVIRVDELVTVPLEEAEEEIRAQLRQQQSGADIQTFVAELFGQAEVEVSSRFGRYDPATGGVAAADPLAE